jgi:hypothetical protein
MAMRRNCERKRDSSVPDSSAAKAHCDAGRAEPPERQWRFVSVAIQEIRGAALPRLMPQAHFISAPRGAQ